MRYGSGQLAVVVLVGGLLAGCGGPESPGAPPAPQGVSPLSRIPFDEISLGVDPGPDRGGRALKEEVFADGEVTFDEYERAMAAYAECLRDEGFDVRGPMPYGPDVGMSLSPGEDPRTHLIVILDEVLDAAADEWYSEVDERCQEQWSFAIETVWREQNVATESDLQQWLERAWECARQRGTALSDPPTELEATLSAMHGFFGDGCVPWD